MVAAHEQGQSGPDAGCEGTPRVASLEPAHHYPDGDQYCGVFEDLLAWEFPDREQYAQTDQQQGQAGLAGFQGAARDPKAEEEPDCLIHRKREPHAEQSRAEQRRPGDAPVVAAGVVAAKVEPRDLTEFGALDAVPEVALVGEFEADVTKQRVRAECERQGEQRIERALSQACGLCEKEIRGIGASA